MFYWKCPICKLTIREGIVEKWVAGKLVHCHKKCVEEQENLEEQANRLLERNGYDKLVLGKKKSEDALDNVVFHRSARRYR